MSIFKKKAGEDAKKEMTEVEGNRLYQAVLLDTSTGRQVLKHMLRDLCFWAPLESQEDVTRRNYAQSLLIRLGCTDDSLVDEFLVALQKKAVRS
jgi:hypothetical protein